ncbi:MAG: branched-chain amino acid ABC transporter permease [Paracoccaceae bacterium]|nr:branched-chain amino acid ABC transporter permease [Paracoccaceae bacterium]
MIQHLIDGILIGSVLSLGAAGLTMIMHILRFANFSHAELLSIGAYAALVFDQIFKAVEPFFSEQIGAFSITWALFLAMFFSLVLTGASAVLFDFLVFRRIREKGDELSMVFASFGLALIIRNLIGLSFGLSTQLYSKDIVFATVFSRDPLIAFKLDHLATLSITLVIMLAIHLVLSRTNFGYSLRAVGENPELAQINGIDLKRTIIMVWFLGGGLAAFAGVFYGLTNQITPMIGSDLVLPVFAATIVGGIGSIYGALLGGFIVGVAANVALIILPSGYSPSVPFLIIIVVLLIRPNGLFGESRI